MKVILSRKGFDSEYGTIPSPILPDGTLLSLPIPADDGIVTYDMLYINDISYSNLLLDLHPTTYHKLYNNGLHCHLDPDIRKDALLLRPRDWFPVFGQCQAAEGHLRNMHVCAGDIFLFFGTFRKTEFSPSGKLRYVPGEPELHIIFGYLQIGKHITEQARIDCLCPWHPHANRNDYTNNSIYIPTNELSINRNLPGSGILSFNDKLVLTKKGYPKSRWNLPDFLREAEISYHPNGFKELYFQSAGKGQEFVITDHNKLEDWCRDLLCQ